MAEEKVKMIKVKHGNVTIEFPRTELVEVSETADGIVFQLKDGLAFEKIDGYMPISAKQLMKNTADSFDQANLEYDLKNYNKPVVANMD